MGGYPDLRYCLRTWLEGLKNTFCAPLKIKLGTHIILVWSANIWASNRGAAA